MYNSGNFGTERYYTKTNLLIKANWDSSARVWVAESDDVPGLVTEASNMEQLIDKLNLACRDDC